MFCTFSLGKVLRATTACTFSTSQLPKVVRQWCVLYILTWKCASRHNGVHFSTSQLPKVVRTPQFLTHFTSKCASRHNGVHFFDISTSKSGPTMVCFVHFDLEMCFAPQRRALFRHRNFQKWSDNGVFLYIFTWKCASRHNGVHFFDISTSKSGPTMVCFVHFHLEMCFAPQRRALFPHLNFQKWSDNGVFLCILTWKCASRHNGVHFFHISTSKSGPSMVCFCTFSLGNVLRATTACTFSTSQLPKAVRQWCVLYILTWKCASRHNGVHFFDISTSKSGPNPSVFNTFYFQMCFAPQRRAIFLLSSGQLAPRPPL